MSDEIKIKIPNINLKKLKKNPCIWISIVLAVLVIIALLNNGFALGISADKAGQNLLEYYQNNGITGLSIDSIEKVSGLYQVNFEYEGNTVPMFVTNDGKYIAQALSPLVLSDSEPTEPEPQDIIKSDKPKVELFIMSICPYGTQAEKGIIPVVELLGDKIDFNLKFVDYAMHDKPEIDENNVQYCIQKEQEDKLIDYLSCYLEEYDETHWNSCLTKVGIDQSKLNSCISATDSEFKITELYNDQSTWSNGRYPQYNVDKTDNDKYDVGGSPTLVINGQKANSARNPAAYLDVICQAFNDAPEECNIELSTVTPDPGFGFESSGSAGSDATC